MRRRSSIVFGAAAGAALLAVVGGFVAITSAGGTTFTASSTALGTSISDLANGPSGSERWRSAGETVGAWVSVEYPEARQVDHVELATGADGAVDGGVLSFSDGSSLLLTPGEGGVVSLDFPARQVTGARFTVATADQGADDVGLSRFELAHDSRAGDFAGGDATVSASSGDPSSIAEPDGAGWRAESGGGSQWLEWMWTSPRSIAAVTIAGSTDTDSGPLKGRIVFGDGSSIPVTGVAPAPSAPTVLAITPRITDSMRLELTPSSETSGQSVALGAVSVYAVGETPERAVPSEPGFSVQPPAARSCDSAAGAAATDAAEPAILCPATGSAVSDEVTVVVATGGAGSVLVEGAPAGGAPVELGNAEAVDGTATATIDLSRFPSGPLALRVTPARDEPVYLQLVKTTGDAPASAEPGHDGMTLQWQEEFTSPASISRTGIDATYAATKPAAWGASEFGEAVFADPAWGNDTLAVVDDHYLRIRVSPLDRADPNSWNRTSQSGMLSSLAVGASGFGAQYGYFEARMLGAPGEGTWPAFWMLNTGSATQGDGSSGEVDAVELYGHDTGGSCHSVHAWSGEKDGANTQCTETAQIEDWALEWHTYGVQIKPGGADYYIDGVRVTSLDGLTHSEEPFYFMVNLALGGGWPIDLEPTGGVSDLYVDWIRVYS